MNKEIFVHVGPPKTGTSAVQKWFGENTDFLKSKGVLYPSHRIDENGVSSGNLRKLYEVIPNHKIKLNENRLKSLLSEFKKSDCKILFLSSEFFFKEMKVLKRNIPNVKFIVYLRNPMDIRESSYNQSVKRHFKTDTLSFGLANKIQYMDKLVDYANEYGNDDLIIRLYGTKYFRHQNIVSDILEQLGIDMRINVPLINNSYQFEALEFKRWLNRYDLTKFQPIIDKYLQKYDRGISNYSLIPQKEYIKESKHLSKLMNTYLKRLKLAELSPIIDDMLHSAQKPHVPQVINEVQFLDVCNFLQTMLKRDYYLLVDLVKRSSHSHEDEFRSIFLSSCDKKYEYVHKLLLLRSKVKLFLVKSKQYLLGKVKK